MPNQTVEQYVAAVRNSVYGKDVRENIVNALTTLNGDIDSNYQAANTRISQGVFVVTPVQLSNGRYRLDFTNN